MCNKWIKLNGNSKTTVLYTLFWLTRSPNF